MFPGVFTGIGEDGVRGFEVSTTKFEVPVIRVGKKRNSEDFKTVVFPETEREVASEGWGGL